MTTVYIVLIGHPVKAFDYYYYYYFTLHWIKCLLESRIASIRANPYLKPLHYLILDVLPISNMVISYFFIFHYSSIYSIHSAKYSYNAIKYS